MGPSAPQAPFLYPQWPQGEARPPPALSSLLPALFLTSTPTKIHPYAPTPSL